MATTLNPYISFRDNAKEAMEFYRSVFGGELTTSTFAEYSASEDPAEQDKLMHAQLKSPNGLVLMAADTPNARSTGPARTSRSPCRARRRASFAATGTSSPTVAWS